MATDNTETSTNDGTKENHEKGNYSYEIAFMKAAVVLSNKGMTKVSCSCDNNEFNTF